MYKHTEINKAVDTLIQFNFQYTKTIRKLGYPSRETLRKWYKDYLVSGYALDEKVTRKSKYNDKQIEEVLNHYFETGENISNTVKAYGYPSRSVLRDWIHSRHPDKQKSCTYTYNNIEYSRDCKTNAVLDLIARKDSVATIAKSIGVSSCTLYNWKNKIVGQEFEVNMKKSEELTDEKVKLNEEIKALKKEVEYLKMEKDVYEKIAEIVKKDQGINLQNLTNKEKQLVIDALRNKYKLSRLLIILNISKSSYFYQKNVARDKYDYIRKLIKDLFLESRSTYGYRRIKIELEKIDIILSEKVIRRIMKEDKIQVVMRSKKRKYNSYMGEISPAVANIIDRDFKSTVPNKKWLTDITEFNIPSGKVYLSPVIDCFDGMIVSWSISTSPTAKMVNEMLRNAISTLKMEESPIIHSDRGGHYRLPEWSKIVEERNLVRSMSKKGCSPDNSACEGFFGRLKNEMFYNKKWSNVEISEFIDELNSYINWYNNKRIKVSLGGLSPVEYRQNLGII